MGYRVGIDDFGSGAASLQYLHGFTVDFVKVDGAVIQRLGKSPREDALLKSVLSTCTELEIETVAEWIDSPEKLQRCRDIGFHYGQGRHFGGSLSELPKPVSQGAPGPPCGRNRKLGIVPPPRPPFDRPFISAPHRIQSPSTRKLCAAGGAVHFFGDRGTIMARAKKAPPKSHNQTQHWRALDAAHHIHPFTQTEALIREGVRVITRAKGIYLWDSDGKKLIDGMSGLWCVQLGYGNKELARAGCEALNTLPYYNHFFKTTNPWTAELAAKLATLLPEGHQHVLFANSGSEATDTALKLIRYYWNLKGRPEKKIHLSRTLSYHGVTMAAASLSGLTPMHPQWDLPFPGFAKVPAPYWYGAKAAGYGDIGPDEFGIAIAREMEKIIREIGPERIASFSAEPVQGAGGLIVPP